MNRIKSILATLIVLVCSSCGVTIATETAQPVLPEFITATLPPTSIPLPTSTPLPPTPAPTSPPVEGTTNTQVNVRAETNTASASYGVVAAFSPVQVTGKDASGTWYKIRYAASPTGAGWVRADYVQLNAPAEIQVTTLGTGGGSEVTGIVVSGINVRNGPGKDFESLGVLVPKDVLLITGKDSTGTWLEIVFSTAPNGKGWVAAEYLQVSGIDTLSILELTEAATETSLETETLTESPVTAHPDGDSMDVPIVSGVLSPLALRTIQVQDEVSAPAGDNEDWVSFSSNKTSVTLHADCNQPIQLSIWEKGAVTENLSLTCGTEYVLKTTPSQMVHVQISIPNQSGYAQYRLTITASP